MQPGNIIARFQRIHWLRPSVVALILSNLVPLAGVFLFHWDVFSLLFLFWLENVIIGIVNVPKMLFANGDIMESLGKMSGMTPQKRQELTNFMNRRNDPAQPSSGNPQGLDALRAQQAALLDNPVLQWGMKLFLVPFFFVHYGGFTIIYGVFVIALFGGDFSHGHGDFSVNMIFQIIRQNHLELAFIGLLVSHLISFGYDYLWRGEYRRVNVVTQMIQPYSRVVLMHITVLGGGILMMLLNSPAAGLVLLVCLKIIFDLSGYQREREKFVPTEIAADEISAGPTPVAPSILKNNALPKNAKIAIVLFFITALASGVWVFSEFFSSFLPIFGQQNAHHQPATAKLPTSTSVTNQTTQDLWSLNLTQVQFRDQEASGRFSDEDFAAARAIYRNGTLDFHQGNRTDALDLEIVLNLPGDGIERKSFTVSPHDATTNSIQINVIRRYGARSMVKQPYITGYAMKLEFGARKQNSVASKIYLCLSDGQKSYLVGNFRTIIRATKTNTTAAN